MWEDILFPVGTEKVFVEISSGGKKLLVESKLHLAIVDLNRQRVFAVVSDQYRLVTNEEAVEMGREVFAKVFRSQITETLTLYNVIQPKSRSFCWIDLTLDGHEFEFRPDDTWIPFLRISNSYNRTRPLGFYLGFCRTICRNGMIFGAVGVKVSAYHTRGAIKDLHVKNYNPEKLLIAKKSFVESMNNLSRFAFPPELVLALVCKIFRIQAGEEQAMKTAARKRALSIGVAVEALTHKYFRDLGHNGYAAFNVLTDFASRPVGGAFGNASSVHRFQEDCTTWIDGFVTEIQKPSFKFETYVATQLVTAKMIQQIMTEDRSIKS